jgi:hypothetical protein
MYSITADFPFRANVEALDCGCALGDVVLEVNGTAVLDQPQAIATVLLQPTSPATPPPPLPHVTPQIQEEVGSAIAEGYPLIKLKLGRTMSRDLKTVVEAVSVSLPVDETA